MTPAESGDSNLEAIRRNRPCQSQPTIAPAKSALPCGTASDRAILSRKSISGLRPILDIAAFRFTDLPAEIRLQIHELCLVSLTPLRLNSYEDGWHDPHAEPAPIHSLLLVRKAVHKEALPVLYVKNKLNFLWTLYEPELPFQYMSPAACSLIIDLAIHVQLARHSHTSYKHISCREIFQRCPRVKRFFVDLEASPNLPIATMRAWTSVA
jgi:hypothetical protein